MKTDSSRRDFLVAGLSLPVAGMASAPAPQAPAKQAAAPASPFFSTFTVIPVCFVKALSTGFETANESWVTSVTVSSVFPLEPDEPLLVL